MAFSYILFGRVCKDPLSPNCHLGHYIAGNKANSGEHDETRYEYSGYNQEYSPDDVGLHFVSPCFSTLNLKTYTSPHSQRFIVREA